LAGSGHARSNPNSDRYEDIPRVSRWAKRHAVAIGDRPFRLTQCCQLVVRYEPLYLNRPKKSVGYILEIHVPHAVRRWLFSLIALAFVAAPAGPAEAVGTTLKVSIWGEMTGTMPTDMGIEMSKTKSATHGSPSHMGITIYQHTIKAGAVTFEVKNNSEKTVHEMLVLPIKDTNTSLPYLKNESRLDESKTKSLGEVSELDPGKSGTLTLNLKPGKYLLTCNVPTHYMAGMWTLLTVGP
jgi:uncharacterized cupredoxin-like copper-binding protein